MSKGKQQIERPAVLPESFDSLAEFWTFWDTHSTADYEDLMEDVEARSEIQTSKIYCAVAKETVVRIRKRAHQEGVSVETLVNLWLREKVLTPAKDK